MSSSVSRAPSSMGVVSRPEAVKSGESRKSDVGVARLGKAVDGAADKTASSVKRSLGETVAGCA